MNKTIMFLGMLAVGFANAQQANNYDGKVGVNTKEPSATLNVKSKTGNTKDTKNFELENADGTKIVTVLDNGKVGIGVENPESVLSVRTNSVGTTEIAEFRNLNPNSFNAISINSGIPGDPKRNTLGFRLSGKDYTNSIPSLSTDQATIFSTTNNGLNFQVHQADAKFKFYTAGQGEGALTMSILPYRVRINMPDSDPTTLSVLSIKANPNLAENNPDNKIGLISRNQQGTNLITYYDSDLHWDAQLGIDERNSDQFQIKLWDPNKYFGIYLNGSTRFTINNSGFTRIGRQAGVIPSMLTIDGTNNETGEQIGLRLQASQYTSTYATVYFDKQEDGGGMKFKTSHNKHGYQFDTNKVSNAFNIQAEGNIGMGTTAPENKLHIKAEAGKDPLRLEGLQVATGTGNQALVVDTNGVVKIGSTVASTGATQLSGTDGIECNKDNRGKMNFKTNDNGSDVFGICMRNKDGNYYWAYMVGGNNPTNGTGTFGSGL